MNFPQLARIVAQIEAAAALAGLDVYADDGAPLAIRTRRWSQIDAEIHYCDEDLIAPDGSIVASITVDFVPCDGARFPSLRAFAEALEHAEELRAFIDTNAKLIHEWAAVARVAGANERPAASEEIDRELHALMDEILGPVVVAIREGRTVGVRR